MSEQIHQAIVKATSGLSILGKSGKAVLQPAIATELVAAGYSVDLEDSQGLLGAGLPVWRSKDNGNIEATRGRRLIDIVVYEHGRPIAFVETESDLNDLRATGVTKRNGHYDVWSIAQSKSATFFHSYKSLERMAAAAFYVALQERRDMEDAVAKLSAIKSDSPPDHNPLGIHLFLVSGWCRPLDHDVLTARLCSLNAHLVCVRGAVAQQSVRGDVRATRGHPST